MAAPSGVCAAAIICEDVLGAGVVEVGAGAGAGVGAGAVRRVRVRSDDCWTAALSVPSVGASPPQPTNDAQSRVTTNPTNPRELVRFISHLS